MSPILQIHSDGLYASIRYKNLFREDQQTSLTLLIFPSLPLKILLRIVFNGHTLSPSYYGGLVEEVATSIESASLWKSLGYETELKIDDRNAEIFVSCSKSSSYAAELDTSASLLCSTCLTLAFLTQKSTICLERILNASNYLITSWLLNMEHSLPFVFSVYGRAVLRLNFAYSKHLIEALFPTDNKREILARTLTKLYETWVLPDFNLFNVLKEIDLSTSKYKRMHQQLLRGSDSSKKCSKQQIVRGDEGNEQDPSHHLGVKSIVYSIALINTADIIFALQEGL